MFKRNVGKTDRMIRIVLGVAILAVGGYYQSWWALVGLAPLATGLASTCGVYSLMGINTCEVEPGAKP